MDAIIKSLHMWDSLGFEDRHNTILEIKKLGRVSNIRSIKKNTKHELICPIHKQKIVTDCKLNECKFNVEYGWSKNCVLYYMNEHSKQRLSPEEISFLYQIPFSEVKDNIKKAFQRVRDFIMSEYIEELIRTKEISKLAFTKSKCIMCFKPLPPELGMDLRIPRGYGWCSSDCKLRKPLEMFQIESQFGIKYSVYEKLQFTVFRGNQ